MPVMRILNSFKKVSKNFLRKMSLKKRKLVARKELNQKSQRIHEFLLKQPEWKKAKTVMLYISIGSEVDTRKLLKKLLEERKKRIVVPVVKGEKLDAVLLENLNLKENKLGVPEPVRGKKVKVEDIDLVVVPGVAFNEKGHRIGLGGGYFDRLLREIYCKKPNVPTIGLAFECQIRKWIPREPHDQKVKKIITEKRIIECHKR